LEKNRKFLQIVSLQFLPRNDPTCTLYSVTHQFYSNVSQMNGYCHLPLEKIQPTARAHPADLLTARVRCRRQKLHQPYGRSLPCWNLWNI